MKRLIKCTVGILAVLLISPCAQGRLQLVANFDGLTGNPDGQVCNGILGGTLDTESEGTGNSSFRDIDGSTTMSVVGHSSGAMDRAIGFGGISNPIDNTETGTAFVRLRVSAGNIRSHMGLVADMMGDPVNPANSLDPTAVPVGFALKAAGAGFDIVTLDGTTVLKTGLDTAQWYNVWIVADNADDMFDLYMSKALRPAGPPTLPRPEDLVKSGIPFSFATSDPLNGMIFATPRSPTGSGQGARIHVDEIWWDGDQGLTLLEKARNPNPPNGATDVYYDGVLVWTASPSAVAHDVYLGTTFDEVSSATPSSPLLVSPGQADNTYYPGRVEFGRTYFWRIDEVNAPPNSTVFKGDVWRFTVEPVAYPIPGARVTATASSSWDSSTTPEKTIDSSGLDASDLHSNIAEDMWLSDPMGPQPTWIEYQLDTLFRLHEMWVWNQNRPFETAIGCGFKNVLIEYSPDGVRYTPLGTSIEFAQAPGTASYSANTTVDLAGIAARCVRLTTNSNWGGLLPQYGLSEVRFLYVPTQASKPNPSSASGDAAIDAILSWRPGREAAEHKVYVSADKLAVIDGTALVNTVVDAAYGPLSLDLDSTYYWRVDEVNGADIWQGDLWSFKTQGYRVVDDFESYNDIPSGEEGSRLVYETWVDGFLDPTTNGSTIGYTEAYQPSMETSIVYDGSQSVPLFYDNTTTSVSEIKADVPDLEAGQDWSRGGAQRLSLWFYGDLSNAPERMYVKVNNIKATYNGSLTTAAWQEWVIDLVALGVDLSNVTTLTIGFERAGTGGGAGKVLLDDLRLYPAPLPEIP